MVHLHHHPWRIALAMGIVVAVATRVLLALQPVPELVWRLTADDAYYYFELVRNFVAGQGFTFDGIGQTNGFHPVYALLLAPLALAAGQDSALLVHQALLLLGLISMATAWPIYLIVRSIYSAEAGRFAVLVWLFNPWTILLPYTGVEAGMYVFWLAWAIERYLAWRSQPDKLRLGLTGVVFGVAIMARSEAGLVLFGVVIDLWLRPIGARRQALGHALLLGALAAVICLPWALWSTHQFGTPFQVSGSAIYLLSHADQPAGLPAVMVWSVLRSLDFVGRYLPKMALYLWPLTLLLPLAALVAWRQTRSLAALRTGFACARGLVFLLLPLAAMFVFYNFVLWHQQHWYFIAPMLLVTLLLSPITWAWFTTPGDTGPMHSAAARYIVLVFCLGAFISITAFVWNRGFYQGTGQAARYRTAVWLAGSPYRNQVLAATDNGIYGFFCDCPMVNLEGVVNNNIYLAHREAGYSATTMAAYMREQDIRLLVLPETAPAVEWGNEMLDRVDGPPNAPFSVYTFADVQPN